MKMGSAGSGKFSDVTKVKEEDESDVNSPDELLLERPKFFPCGACGRKFTLRALEIHKRSCTEKSDCSCSVCKTSPAKHSEHAAVTNDRVVLSDRHNTDPELANRAKVKYLHNGKVYCVITRNPSTNNCQSKHLAIEVGGTEEASKVLQINGNCLKPAAVKHSDHSYSNVDFNSVSENSSDSKNDLPYFSDVSPNTLVNSFLSRSLASESGFKVPSKIYVVYPNSSNCGKPPEKCAEVKKPVDDKIEEGNSTELEDVVKKEEEPTITEPPGHSLLCNVCNKEIYYDSFGSHIIQHCQVLLDKYLLCPKCPQKFSKPGKLLIHFHKHMAEFAFACTHCDESFPSCSKLKRHTLKVHKIFALYPFHCYICLRRFTHSQTIINHMRLHSKETPFKCHQCSRSFNQIGNLHRHLSVHRGERPHKCQDCNKAFADPATLRNHVRIHTGETPYVCKICKRAFTQIGNLKRHMARHLQGRSRTTAPYSYGAKLIKSDSSLNSSVDSTEENKPVVPNDKLSSGSDNKSFSSSEDLPNENFEVTCTSVHEPEVILKDEDSVPQPTKKYKRNEALESVDVQEEAKRVCDEKNWELFQCPVCSKIYTWQHDLNIHFRIHSGEKPYSCDICHKKFAQSGAVRTHKLRHHWDVIPAKEDNV